MTKFYAQEKRVFDINKVTVVGSPTITSDGVASGFSGSSYIKKEITLTNNWGFVLPVKVTNETVTTQWISTFLSEANERICLIRKEGNYLYIQGFNGAVSSYAFTIPYVLNQTVYLKAVKNGTSLVLSYSNDLKNWIEKSFDLTVYTIPNVKNVNLGIVDSSWQAFLGSINLSQFSITVDGKEVYSPTKPVYALERRKPKVWNKGQFTIFGNPTISESGVASGFDSISDALIIPNLNINEADNWEIEGVVQVFSNGGQQAGVWLSPKTGNGIMLPCAYPSTGANIQYQLYLSSTSSSWDISNGAFITFPSGSKVKCNLKFTGTQYIYTCTNLDTNEVKSIEVNSSLKIYQSPELLGRKRAGTANSAFTGSIDLKSFKIYTDNNLVFDGGAETYVYDSSKFTVVGSPTITEYGVASGLNDSNYIQATTIDYSKNWEIVVPFKTGSTISAQVLLTLNTGTTFASNYLVLTGAKSLSFRLAGLNLSNIDSTSLKENTDYIAKIGWDGSRYYLKINGQEYYRNSSTALEIDEPIKLGTISNSGWIFQGTINLSQFSITVDGKEVFTGAKEKFYAMRRN